MTAWMTPRSGPAAAIVDAIAAVLPRLETERLILRAPKVTDWPTLEPIWTEERAKYIGGPFNSEDAWLDFNGAVASWVLRGTGALTIALKDDSPIGMVVLGAEYGDPEDELGWLLIEEAEGKGFATEAATAMRDWALDMLGAGNLVSYVHDDNAASHNVARKIGAIRDPKGHSLYANCTVYRHGGHS